LNLLEAVQNRHDTQEKKVDILEIDHAGVLVFARDRNTIKTKIKKEREGKNEVKYKLFI
jgi:hypothetical protein